VAHGQSPDLSGTSRSQIIQKFFGSFFQKRTERKHFFFEKKKQKTFFNLASVYGFSDSLVLGVLRVFVVEIEGGWEDCVLQVGERDQQRLK
jgi:hypothetical protein